MSTRRMRNVSAGARWFYKQRQAMQQDVFRASVLAM